MKTINNEICAIPVQHVFGGDSACAAHESRRGLGLLIVAALWTGASCAPSNAQTVIGSPGAGFQQWTVGNLNNNKAPNWDDFTLNASGVNQSKNMGFCLTGTGDCVGIGTLASAQERYPFVKMPIIRPQTPAAVSARKSIFTAVPMSMS